MRSKNRTDVDWASAHAGPIILENAGSPLTSSSSREVNVSSDAVSQFRCALYGRVSTRYKNQEVESQVRQLREFAAHSGWTIVAEYIDHETGKISDREQFQRMFADASQRKFDVLLFWSLDRLSREGVLPTLHIFNG